MTLDDMISAELQDKITYYKKRYRCYQFGKLDWEHRMETLQKEIEAFIEESPCECKMYIRRKIEEG